MKFQAQTEALLQQVDAGGGACLKGAGPSWLTLFQMTTCPREKTNEDTELGGYGRECGSGKGQVKGGEYDQSTVYETLKELAKVF